MIPRKIHYCWFGNNPKSKLILECIESWKQFCPDFEIIEWNELNSKQYSNSFYINALRKKKYAFAADYIRAKVLNEYGGIYLDTDMLLLKPIDLLLDYNFFIGEEVPNRINFAIFGSIKNHNFLREMIEFYENTEFNVFSPPVITHTFSPIINRENVGLNEKIFPLDYFYSLPYENRGEDYLNYKTENSLALHLWDHSWKIETKNDLIELFKNLKIVMVDYLFYNYSSSYFKRYFKEFSRKIYHAIKSKL
jgi:mannosyltransferase OCH1-like enzyme